MGPLIHGLFSVNTILFSVVRSLWMPRADCMRWSMPFCRRDLNVLIFCSLRSVYVCVCMGACPGAKFLWIPRNIHTLTHTHHSFCPGLSTVQNLLPHQRCLLTNKITMKGKPTAFPDPTFPPHLHPSPSEDRLGLSDAATVISRVIKSHLNNDWEVSYVRGTFTNRYVVGMIV